MKFAVGVMLTSFGLFWGAEGAHAEWPGADAALLVIVPSVAVLAVGLAWLLHRRCDRDDPQQQVDVRILREVEA